MNVDERNRLLASENIDRDDLWPKVKEYESRRFQFRWEFGLQDLPQTPGVITIRGPRQSGKSTWLELQLLKTIEDHNPGSAFFLSGDSIYSHQEFEQKLLDLEASFRRDTTIKRIFIDEVTQIEQWERVIKRLIDIGHLRDCLIVTTGSNAADLRRGSERLPGRKGQLKRTEYVFLPIPYREYRYTVGTEIGTLPRDPFWGYVLTGGAPLAVESLAYDERLSDTFCTLVTDWVLGDMIKSGRSRIFLLNTLKKLFQAAPNPISYTNIAKDAGLANNSAALSYVERLSDLLIVSPMMQWDADKDIHLARKPSKIQFINLAAAWTFHPKSPRSIHELKALESNERGAMFEWLVAQELWRRETLKIQSASGIDLRQPYEPTLSFWASKDHEIDFVTASGEMFEVKAGPCSPQDFSWFSKIFPKRHLHVISESRFETSHVTGITFEEFLYGAPTDLYFDSDKEISLPSSQT
jgi:uncharacterized protein